MKQLPGGGFIAAATGGGGGGSPLTFTPTVSAQTGTQGVAFSWAGAALSSFFSGGTTPYTYAAVGTLPAGLSINSSTGVVSGTPSAAVTVSIVFQATDAAAAVVSSGSVTFTVAAAIPVTPATALDVTGPSGGAVGAPSTSITITANGTLAASKTITASDGAGGSFSFASGTTLVSGGSVTCTYTPLTVGAKTLTFSVSDASLTADTLAYSSLSTSYSLTVGPFGLNTGSGPLLSTLLSYTVWAGVDTGAVSGSAINGTATTHATTGVLVIPGLTTAGSYLVSLKNADGSGRWHNLGTAS